MTREVCPWKRAKGIGMRASVENTARAVVMLAPHTGKRHGARGGRTGAVTTLSGYHVVRPTTEVHHNQDGQWAF
jgi:hypothetical protein